VLQPRRKPPWVSSSFGSIISADLGIKSSWETKQKDAVVVGSFNPVSLSVHEDDQFANLSVPFQNAMPLDTHVSAKPSGVLSSPNSLSNISQLCLKLGVSSGITELIDAQFCGSFHLYRVIQPEKL